MGLKFDVIEILKVTMVLFAVIDVIGSIPVILNLKQNVGQIRAARVALISFSIMIVFLFVGNYILDIIGISIEDFAIAGSILLFIIAFEMILGIRISKDEVSHNTASVVPLAFPLIAGTGTLSTLLSIRTEYNIVSIVMAIILNVIVVYYVLRYLHLVERFLGTSGISVLKKVFGIVLLALAIKLFRSNTGI